MAVSTKCVHIAILLLIIVMVQWRTASGQLPRRIDVTWFEHHHRWTDAFADATTTTTTTEAGEEEADASEQGDRHTQRLMRELSAACKTSPVCVKKSNFDKVTCIRKCVSAHCYASVYAHTPLEPGEIDVNYSKYKKCFHNMYKNKYKSHLKKR